MKRKKKNYVEDKGDSRHPRRLKLIHAVVYKTIRHSGPITNSQTLNINSDFRK